MLLSIYIVVKGFDCSPRSSCLPTRNCVAGKLVGLEGLNE